MGLFDSIKQALKGAASTAVQSAEQSAKESITSGVSGSAEGTVGGVLSHLGNVPGGNVVADAMQSGANAAIQGTVNSAANAADQHLPGEG